MPSALSPLRHRRTQRRHGPLTLLPTERERGTVASVPNRAGYLDRPREPRPALALPISLPRRAGFFNACSSPIRGKVAYDTNGTAGQTVDVVPDGPDQMDERVAG